MRLVDKGQFDRPSLKSTIAAGALGASAYTRFRLHGRDLLLSSRQLAAFARDACSHLPPDPYSNGDRNRRHAAALYIDDGNPLRPVNRVYRDGQTFSIYYQSPFYNPEVGGVHRLFAALTEAQMQSPVLRAIIDYNYRIARRAGVLADSSVYMVGIHINQQAPAHGSRAAIVPPFIHRDGEPVTFAHLLGRENVVGGWTAVAKPESLGKHPDEVEKTEILARFTLEQPFESYAVDDCRVAHHADAVSAVVSGRRAHRTMLLIDFRPMREIYTHDLLAA